MFNYNEHKMMATVANLKENRRDAKETAHLLQTLPDTEVHTLKILGWKATSLTKEFNELLDTYAKLTPDYSI